ncbi:MAG: hypothetical protein ACRC8Y_19565 [Chroococcales cyanobacterium]
MGFFLGDRHLRVTHKEAIALVWIRVPTSFFVTCDRLVTADTLQA